MNGPSIDAKVRIITALVISLSVMLIQCRETHPESTQNPQKHAETISYNGYKIHLFPSAEEQLRYARTRFSDPRERRASFEVVLECFPESKLVRAEAELEIAYLKLGIDHRFADRSTCMRALNAYHQIISRFSDLPEICAKAHWYMGWIHADLLNQKRQAIVHYRIVYERYPDARIKIESPITWVVLVMPQNKTEIKAVDRQKVRYWASLALLEIIRNSAREQERWEAFQTLWSDYRSSLETGYALCALLNGPKYISRKVIGRAKEYLEEQDRSQPLADEIRKGLIEGASGVQ